MKLRRSWYERHAPDVAIDLLGKVLARKLGEASLRGRIVEVEAYTGREDPGSHAFRGPTPRSRLMFGPAGHLYVYLSYGMHCCMNVVTDANGVAGAVLIRAVEPLVGTQCMASKRGNRPSNQLCNGPGKLCEAFAITRDQNGADLECSDIWIEDDGYVVGEMARSLRVGLSAGAELPLRFYLAGSPFVSQRGVRAIP
ncbi:MAG: DNA-3-methyladenine glycosylase [Chloroflexota bacterium]